MPTTRKKTISLHFESAQTVMVTSDDEDRFMTTATEAARACRAAESAKWWTETFKRFLAHLNWRCAEMSNDIVACYVNIGDDGLRVFIATTGEDYVPAIADKITEIDVDLATRFPECPADCVQIPSVPRDSLDSFFSVEDSLKVYGKLRIPSQ